MNRRGGAAPEWIRRLALLAPRAAVSASMAPRALVLAALALLSTIPTAAAVPSRATRTPAPAPAPATAYEKIFAELDGMSPDPARVATVQNLILRRDVATIQFTQGQMALFRPVEGRIWGCVFTGRGTFAFRPPTTIERDQLKRFYDTDSLATKFETIVLLFADTTLVELAAEAKFTMGTIADEAPDAVQKCLDLLLDSKSKDVNYSVGKTCLEGASNELFLAFVGQKGSKGFIYEIDPFQREQVQLWRQVKATFFQYRVRNREVICQFPLEADREREADRVEASPGGKSRRERRPRPVTTGPPSTTPTTGFEPGSTAGSSSPARKRPVSARSRRARTGSPSPWIPVSTLIPSAGRAARLPSFSKDRGRSSSGSGAITRWRATRSERCA